ncbi:MAG: DUF6504 family protein [Actinomycetia bacterium]|nr:DUF6504 family protein [Actinomycetes bacterium]
MRRIDESIESLTPVASGGTAPLAFRWRGRRYVVGAVLAHWVETGAWWRRTAPRPTSGSGELPDPERWLWRVEACRGAQTGVFDLCLEVDDSSDDNPRDRGLARWSLHAIYD